MPFWLAATRTVQESGFIKRFDPRFWTVDFPRPMMASVVTTATDALRVDAVFYRTDDLAGLIWAAEDKHDHPLLAYETRRDFRDCTLRFRWRSGGVIALDAVNGPVLTIEGRNAAGVARAWYVRLWNYATGTPDDAGIALDFAAIDGGFLLPGEADPVWAGDVDRMFFSLVAPGYTGAAGMLPAPVEGWAELSDMYCDGGGSVIAIGDVIVPPHGLSIATGYDDSYNLTPARMLRNILQLGYRGAINHYVGMSHYFRLGGGLLVSAGLNAPCAAWHGDFAKRAGALGFSPILSLSYELFDAHCPETWKQRAANGDPALTGYTPPSTLLSPASADAMDWLQGIARDFTSIARVADLPVRFQIGEPWWWTMADGRICLYDNAARAALGGDPPAIDDVHGALDGAQIALLDAAGALLAASTAALVAAVRSEAPGAETLLLVYLPGTSGPGTRRANMPIGWATPAFDVLQLEDYEWVTGGNRAASTRAIAEATTRLGYPIAAQHYLAGFASSPDDAGQWAAIDAAADAALARGTGPVFLWALPQVLRDGYVRFATVEDEVDAFDDVDFPLALGRGATVTPGFSTAVVTTASGHEQRNAGWADARITFDAGPGIRGEADIATLIGFFRARRGAARAFRFRDPFDWESEGMIGTGDGLRTQFPLVKDYDGQVRRITRPVAEASPYRWMA